MLEQERAFYAKQLPAWLNLYAGKFVLVKGEQLHGVFDTPDAALAEGARLFGREPFMVRPVVPVQAEIQVPALTLGLLRADFTHPV